MKKILIVHNTYKFKGGEDIAVSNEINFLKNHFEVETLIFKNEIKNLFKQIVYFVRNNDIESTTQLTEKLDSFKPDFVYVHNTWFKASLEIFQILEKRNLPVLLKLHNFRYKCTRHYFKKNHLDGQYVCNACGMSDEDSLIFNKYFKESFLKSLLVINYGIKYFKILRSNNLKILVLTNFHKQILSELGISNEKIFVYPNYLNFENTGLSKTKENFIVYAGRISKEKGVEELINEFLASKITNTQLRIIGDGPLLTILKDKYSNYKNLIFMGEMDNQKVLKIIASAKAVVTGTKLLEGQPTLLCEASMLETPSIFPSNSGISEFFPINSKLSYEPNNFYELRLKIKLILDDKLLIQEGKKNKEFLKNKLSDNSLITNFEEILNAK